MACRKLNQKIKVYTREEFMFHRMAKFGGEMTMVKEAWTESKWLKTFQEIGFSDSNVNREMMSEWI